MSATINNISTKKFVYVVPRSFRLRQELEFAEKGTPIDKSNRQKSSHDGYVTFGIDDISCTGDYGGDRYNTQLANWNATLIGPQSVSLNKHPL